MRQHEWLAADRDAPARTPQNAALAWVESRRDPNGLYPGVARH